MLKIPRDVPAGHRRATFGVNLILSSSEPSVLLTTQHHIATITLNRPAKLNAFDGEMVLRLDRTVDEVRRQSDSLRCVLLTGAGRGFCAGADLDFLIELRRGNRREEFRSLLEAGRRVVTSLREMAMPTIALVNGPAAGGGGALAMACDVRLAADTARFTQAFAKIGVHADFGATFFLPRLVGESKARELMFTGETIDAAEALRIGLVSQMVSAAALRTAAEAFVGVLVARAPLSLRLMKQTLAQASREAFQEALDREMEAQLQCFQSEDFLRGIEAFAQKTPALFVGK